MISLLVYALINPPTLSISSAICKALLFSVPLNAICSRKWAIPFSIFFSFRLPAFIQIPTDTLSIEGISSVTTLIPFLSLSIFIVTLNLSVYVVFDKIYFIWRMNNSFCFRIQLFHFYRLGYHLSYSRLN